MREAWRPLLFADEDLAAKATRDLVAPVHRSATASHKAARHRTPEGTPVHSFRTLLDDLATIVRNSCRTRTTPDGPTFAVTTTATTAQRRALDLLNAIA